MIVRIRYYDLRNRVIILRYRLFRFDSRRYSCSKQARGECRKFQRVYHGTHTIGKPEFVLGLAPLSPALALLPLLARAAPGLSFTSMPPRHRHNAPAGPPPPTRIVRKRPTPYEVLQLPDDASEDDIKHSFRKLALRLHPDKLVSASDEEREKAEVRFKEVNAAYSLLSDSAKRARYDAYGDEDDDDDGGSGGGADGGGGGGGGGGRGKGGKAAANAQWATLSLEEILALTFGARRRHYAFGALPEEARSALAVLQLVLPLALFIALAVAPPASTPAAYAGTAQPPFRMQPDQTYAYERRAASHPAVRASRHPNPERRDPRMHRAPRLLVRGSVCMHARCVRAGRLLCARRLRLRPRRQPMGARRRRRRRCQPAARGGARPLRRAAPPVAARGQHCAAHAEGG